jgi:hypothetical protein
MKENKLIWKENEKRKKPSLKNYMPRPSKSEINWKYRSLKEYEGHLKKQMKSKKKLKGSN